jgi:hypothetical protein
MGKKSSTSAPPPPDLSPYADAMMANGELQAEIGHMQLGIQGEQLAWAKEMGQRQIDMQQQVLDVQLPMMRDQARWAREDRKRWENVFKPLENELIADAKTWNTEEKRELEAGRAQADITRSFEAQRQNTLRNLEGYGIDPSQTRYQALDAQVRSQQAAAQAGAGNMARNRVVREGQELQRQAVTLGRGLPMQAVQTGQSASGIGSQAVQGGAQSMNAQTGARGMAAQYGGLANQAFSGAGSSFGAAGGLINSGYENQLGAWKAQNDAKQANNSALWSGIGTAAGAAAMFAFADGGEAGKVANAGEVEGPGGPKSDAIPAQLSDQEYVIPAEVVHYKGTEFFDKLINKSHENMGIPPEQVEMQDGVPVQGAPQGGQ